MNDIANITEVFIVGMVGGMLLGLFSKAMRTLFDNIQNIFSV